jgi:hypothetical protein
VTFEPRDYVVLNLVIVTLVVISYIFVRRTPRQPVQLNLNKPKERDVTGSPAGSSNIRNFSRVEYRPRATNKQILGEVLGSKATRPHPESAGFETTNPGAGATDLNVLFNWNGHTWDAYEVLDIPAGSSVASAKAAFEKLKKELDPQSFPFLTAAFEAIRQKR